MTRYCKCFDYACRYNLCAKTLRVSDLEMLDEATGERIFSVYCEHGTGFAKGNVREKDIVFTDSQGREAVDNLLNGGRLAKGEIWPKEGGAE